MFKKKKENVEEKVTEYIYEYLETSEKLGLSRDEAIKRLCKIYPEKYIKSILELNERRKPMKEEYDDDFDEEEDFEEEEEPQPVKPVKKKVRPTEKTPKKDDTVDLNTILSDFNNRISTLEATIFRLRSI